jgi:lipoprotein-releasing system permease protein
MGFINLITNISIAGVILGTLVLVVALSIANGMEKEVRDRIVGTFAHGRISRFHSKPFDGVDSIRKVIETHPEVVATAPVILGKGAVEHASLQEGVMIMAVDDSLEKHVSELHNKMIDGTYSLDSATSKRDRKFPGIIIGNGLARKFGVRTGSEIVAMSLVQPEGEFDPIPKMMRFTVTGVFETGMYEYDQMLIVISLKSGQKLFEINGVEGINFRCKDMFRADSVARSLVELLGGYPYKYNDWKTQNSSLFQWMKLEKLMIFAIISMIILVAAFNITSSLIMMIMEKRREIGILMSMGATRGAIMRIFMINGAVIGMIGAVSGTGLGLLLSWLQQRYQFIPLPGDVYFINFVPVLIRASDVIFIFVLANAVSIGAALYPAWQASKMLPADAVRLD